MPQIFQPDARPLSLIIEGEGRLLQRTGWKGADEKRRLYRISRADPGRDVIRTFRPLGMFEPSPLGYVLQTRVLHQLCEEPRCEFSIPLGSR